MNSGALDGNQVEPEDEEDAPRVPTAVALGGERKSHGAKRKAGEMDGDDDAKVEENGEETDADGDELAATKKPNPACAETRNPRDEPDALKDSEKGETLSSDSEDEPRGGARGVDVSGGNLVLAQFDKVSHSKNKWKCSLKGGAMTLNNRDVLFGKANGEFTW